MKQNNYIPTIFEDYKVDTKTLLFNSIKTITNFETKKNIEGKDKILNLVKETIKNLRKENFDVDNIEPSNYEIQLVLSGLLLTQII